MKKEAVFTSKGQLVIPAATRRRYRIGKGTRVHIDEVATGILLRPLTDDPIDRLCGMLAGKGYPHRIEKDSDREIR
ncbi:MAG TPA: AbrB/MazE/SpoVT family DNA-binding domain-containing protein [Terriglobales bacterium]|nr:AbrB/MazE/SpoVT family DNA-binding domain-containing protein [Terriglobales bacterium]